MATERLNARDVCMNNDSTIYNDFGTESRQPESTDTEQTVDETQSTDLEQTYKPNPELIAVLDEIAGINDTFKEAVDRIKDHGINVYGEGEGGFRFVVQEWVGYDYQYNLNLNVHYNGSLIIPDRNFTYQEITNAKGGYSDFVRILKNSVPEMKKEIESIIASFATFLRINDYYRETDRQWEQIKNHRFKDRNNLQRFDHIEDAMRCGGMPFTNENGKIDVDELGDFIIHKFNIKTLNLGDGKKNKQMYYYYPKKGVYIPNGNDLIHTEAINILRSHNHISLAEEVIHNIKYKTLMKPEFFKPYDPYIINVRNGLLDIRTGELSEHTPEYLSTIQFDIKYDPQARCPVFNQFMLDVLPNEMERTVMLEYMGYLLVPLPNTFQKFIMILGLPGTGKSKLMSVIRRIIGKENRCAVDLQKLENDRFALYRLFNKLVNICADMPKTAMADNSVLKKITGSDDDLLGEPKGKDSFEFHNFCKIICSLNKLPYVPDDMAFFRRLMLIDMNQVMEGTDKEDPHIEEKLTTDSELSGIMNLIIENFNNVLKNKKFSYTRTKEEVREIYERKQNHVLAFFSECTEESDEDVPKDAVYAAYLDWCKANGIDEMLGKRALTETVKRSKTIFIDDGKIKTKDYRDVRVWKNLSVKHPWTIRGRNTEEKPMYEYPPNPVNSLPDMSKLSSVQPDEPLHDYN